MKARSQRIPIICACLLLLLFGILLVVTKLHPDQEMGSEKAIPVTDSLQECVLGLRHEGRYAEALQTARVLAEVLEEDSTVKTWEIGDARRSIATLESICSLSVATQEELAEAEQLSMVIRALRNKADYRKAIETAERQLSIRRRYLSEDHHEVGASLANLATLWDRQDEHAVAESLLAQATAILTNALDPENPRLATFLTICGGHQYDQGRYVKAEETFAQALRIKETAFGDEHPDVAWSLQNLAIAFFAQGKYGEAEAAYKRASVILENSDEVNDVALVKLLNNLGTLNYRLGKCEDARLLHERVLAIGEKLADPTHPDLATNMNNLAIIYRNLGMFAKAEDLHSQALAIRERRLGREHTDVAMSLENLALVCVDSGRYREAGSHFERALGMWRRLLGPEHPSTARCLHEIGVSLLRQSKYEEAEGMFRQALEARRRVLGPRHPAVATTLEELGNCMGAMNELEMAEDYLSEAAEVFESARLRVGAGFERATFHPSPYERLAATRLLMGNDADAWPAIERSLGRALADLLIASEERPLDLSDRAREDSLKAALAHLEDEMVAIQKAFSPDPIGGIDPEYRETRTRLLLAEAAWESFAQEMAAKYPVTEGQALPLEHVQALLGNHMAFVGWLHVELTPEKEATWGYVVRNSGPVHWVRLDSTRHAIGDPPLAERIRTFKRKMIVAGSWSVRVPPAPTDSMTARSLWRHCLKPMLPHLEGVEHLVVIPSGPMLGLPIEALLDSTGTYVIDRYTVSYTPSATLYAWLRQQLPRRATSKPQHALLVGDPPLRPEHLVVIEREQGDRDTPGNTPSVESDLIPGESVPLGPLTESTSSLAELPCLPMTRAEVEQIASLVPEAVVLLGREASEQELARLADTGALRRFDTIHLATHALVDNVRPERSSLILSCIDLPDPLEAARDGERLFDGRLSVKEIVRQWDLNADLVTLSACQTALGKEIPGEGYIGLAHAFLQAGARSLLVSLWKVDDEATALLMRRFYENLAGEYRGVRANRESTPMTKIEAIREAKAWLRDYRDSKGQQPFQHPTYWSAFVLVGEP